MVVFNFSHPRSGCTWTNNVTRALLEMAGRKVLPCNMEDDLEFIDMVMRNRSIMRPDEVYVHAAHLYFASQFISNDVKVVNNYRDVRDAMLSLMRFVKMDFEQALECAQDTLMPLTDHYFHAQQEHPDDVLRIKYNHMMSDPAGTVRSIGSFLGLDVDESAIEQITDRFSRRKVQELLKNMEQLAVNAEGGVDDDDENRYRVINDNFDGSSRVFDRRTKFQTNHISSKKDGEWRDVFTPEQQQRVLQVAGDWLEKYGFEI